MREGLVRDWLMRGFAIALLVVIAATSYWYSRVIRIPGAAPPPTPGTPDFVVDRLTLTQFDEQGRAKYRLFAQQLFHFNENDDILLSSPRLVTLYADRPQIETRSHRARLENGGERVLLTGSVLLTRAAAPDNPPLAISTEAMTAWPDDDRYVSDTRTEIERGQGDSRFRTAADRMAFDNLKREIDFFGRVRTEIPARGR
jgi:lipopolysaccharide export system protein LptC